MKSMEYSEIVEKIRHKTPLHSTDITGYQLIKLLFDREVTTVCYKGNTFEVNFVPVTYAFTATPITEEYLPTFKDGERLITQWIECNQMNASMYAEFNDDYFEIKLELLESA
jgi:hypothetical protein